MICFHYTPGGVKGKDKHNQQVSLSNLKIFSVEILLIQKIILPLHPLNSNDGGIAQLVRAHDS